MKTLAYIVFALLFPVTALAQPPAKGPSLSWQRKVITLVNVERVVAGVEPLVLDQRISVSAQWWVNTLTHSGLGAAHSWWTDREGYLIASPDNPRILNSRVWVATWLPPSTTWGITDQWRRLDYLGVYPAEVQEVGALMPSLTPERVVDKWLEVQGHRAVLLDGRWTHAGVGCGPGDAGKKRAYIDFIRFE